jgi:hypothetical protein
MIMAILRWSILCVSLFVWGCASIGPTEDFKFIPITQEIFPEVQETRLYTSGVSQPHQVIGEVTVRGESDESEESLEGRLLEGARKVGAQGVIVVERGQTVSELGIAGIRHDDFGGAASRDYRIYPPPLIVEEDYSYIRGLALRFRGE